MRFPRSVTFLIGAIVISGCSISQIPSALDAPSPIVSIETRDIPNEWKLTIKEEFSISLPPDMKEKEVRGTDTSVWEFESNDITISIEIGFLGGDLSFEEKRYESEMQNISVNNLIADRLILDLNKPILKNWAFNADGSTKISLVKKHLVTALYFPDKKASFWVAREPNVPAEIADMILNSIKLSGESYELK